MEALDRFLRYVSYDTESDSRSKTYPSTKGQWELLDLLYRELKEMGITDVRQDKEYGVVYATLPSNCKERTIPAIGFIAHVDTSEAMSGADIRPRVIENYDGGDIVLNAEAGIVTRISDFPEMAELKGKRIMVTDGTTLLGSDDKSGITEIMEMVKYFTEHEEEAHGNICIAFTADEETGRGVDYFDVQGFGAMYAYTVDGGREGEISEENFNAASGMVTVHGASVHPGEAYHKMKNACLILEEFNRLLPEMERPEHTKDREGFYHLSSMSGNVETAEAEYIIRDHDMDRFEERKRVFQEAAQTINRRYGEGTVDAVVEEQYLNMKQRMDLHPEVMEKAIRAMKKCGMEPIVTPIRGGTDGARLSYMGLPCPNLCTGGGNFHGKYEYLCVDEMVKTIEVLKQLVREWAAED